jgi:Flp pilus assembly protein TadG
MTAAPRPQPPVTRSDREGGQAVILIVLCLAVLLGAAALTIDVGYAYYTHRSLQADADAAALAGAAGFPDTTAAQNLAKQYSGSTGSKNQHTNLPAVDTSVTLACLGTPGCTTMNAVKVTEHATVSTFFARILGVKTFNVTAHSTACSPGLGAATLVDENTTSCPLPPGPCTLGYPFNSSNPRTSTQFNESEVLRTFAPNLAGPDDTIKVWYNDEHALTLGTRAVTIVTPTGKKTTTSTTTNYPFTTLGAVPSSTTNPAVGTTALSGDFSGVDSLDRPEFPALFVTDITSDASSRSGDWQFGGTPIPPEAVFGTWKGAEKVIDKSKSPAQVSVTPDADPAKNNWTLGTGSDTVPSGQTNEGYGAEVRWKVSSLGLQPGHAYRMQFMVHDGDQHSTGGDVGEACMHVVIPG